ncbi:sulfatase [Sinomicrobium kalidii]|uniref:sulfatase family protein n=1 Tax=Sinomicrobium kalidii TaxID=2900738 RepID=UPI001E401560|nr:sulfatase [Sinomicrobium kalidii]UGU17435.1 sulfatase [Sinomicrobium kalidii]
MAKIKKLNDKSLVMETAKIKRFIAFVIILSTCICCGNTNAERNSKSTDEKKRRESPNILFVISDDQSYPHASVYGEKWIKTPAFDRVSREGVLFTNAFAASPGCSPSRAAILTGMNDWQLEDAGTHASEFPLDYTVFPDILEKMGYKAGYTGKGWGPGNWKISGRKRNPAGEAYNKKKNNPPTKGISTNDYSENFNDFLAKKKDDEPFCFWFGAHEPHRGFEKGSGLKAGKDIEEVTVPAFLPDDPTVREDLLNYALEIEWFDQHLGKILEKLEETGELENTIIVVTSDNGMAFPRAKSNTYEYGIHVPLAIMWGNQIEGGRIVDDPVSLIDIAPTFLEAVSVEGGGDISGKYAMEGKSLMNLLMNDNEEAEPYPVRRAAFAARERHSSSRWNNLTYPQRAIRTEGFLYIRNFKPERWPAGAPQKYESDGTLGPEHGGYHDIDASPTFDFMLEHRNDSEIRPFFEMAVGKRPAEELYDIKNDPYCLVNLAGEQNFEEELLEHRRALGSYLMQTNDPRVTGNGDIYETYIRYSFMRKFPKPDWLQNDSLARIRIPPNKLKK